MKLLQKTRVDRIAAVLFLLFRFPFMQYCPLPLNTL